MTDETTPQPPGLTGWHETLVHAAIASVPWIGGALEVVYTDVRKRMGVKADVTVDEILAITGEDEFIRRIAESPRIEALFVNSMDAAIRTGLEPKRKLLARAVAGAIHDDALVDHNELVADALTQLDVQHARALAALADEWERTQASEAESPTVNVGQSKVWGTLPEPIRAALVRTGTGRSSPTTVVATTGAQRTDGITDFGIEMVRLLRDQGLE